MSKDRDKLEQAQEIQKELNDEGLSRRGFLDRLKVLGAGFGAAYVLGFKDADAAVPPDGVVNLNSSHPALNAIVEEGRANDQLAQYDKAWAPYRRAYSKSAGYSRGSYLRGPVPYGRQDNVRPYSRYSRATAPDARQREIQIREDLRMKQMIGPARNPVRPAYNRYARINPTRRR